jgi:hypothetical protein
MRLALTTCLIRPWALTDAESLQRHANNRNVSLYLRDRFPFPYEIQHAVTFLDWITQQPAPTDRRPAAVGAIGIDGERTSNASAEITQWRAVEPRLSPRGAHGRDRELFRVGFTRLYVYVADHAASVRAEMVCSKVAPERDQNGTIGTRCCCCHKPCEEALPSC